MESTIVTFGFPREADFPNCSDTTSHRTIHIRNQARYLRRLGDVFFEQYKLEGPLDLLVVVGQLYRQSLDLTAIADDNLLVQTGLTKLADYYLATYELKHDISALETSVKLYRRALDQFEVESSRTIYQSSLARLGLSQALYHRYRALSRLEDGHVAIQMLQECIDCNADRLSDHQSWVLVVISLMKSDTKISDIITVTSATLQDMLSHIRLIPKTHFLQSQFLLALIAQARLSWALCYATKQQEHLHNGLEMTDLGLSRCPRNAEVIRSKILIERMRLHDAANMHHWGNDQKHLDVTITTSQILLNSLYAAHNPYVRSFARSYWAESLIKRSIHDGDYDGMEEAVDGMKQALLECPLDHLLRPGLVCNLTYLLGLYFQYTGRVSVLDELISLQDIYPDYVIRETYLAGNIAEMMLVRAQLTDTETARLLITQATKLCQNRIKSPNFAMADKPERGAINVHLINASHMQLQMGLKPVLNLDTSLELARQALTVEYYIPSRIRFVIALAEILISKARKQHELSPLSEAATFLEHELAAESMTSSPYCVDVYAAQADVLVAQHDISQDASLLPRAWELYSLTVTTSSGRSRNRFQSCLRWASNAAGRGHASIAFEAYSCAIDLLPRVVFLGEDVIGRIEALRQVNGLAASSVATALTMGKVAEAIDFLERTRGILWLQSFQSQPAAELDLLPVNLQSQYSSTIQELGIAERMHWAVRRRKAEQLNKVLEEIRCIPTFQRFLLPPLLQELETVLQKRRGYAIIIVPSTRCCDVVMLGGPEGHAHLRLAALNIDKIRELAQDFISTHSTARAVRQDQARRGVAFSRAPDTPEHLDYSSNSTKLLAELWFSLVRPIMDSLGLLNRTPCEPRQRLWWCPTGALSSLPIHAAGVYNAISDEHVSTYAVSSYTSTLTALHRTLSDDVSGSTVGASAKVLLIGQPDSTNLPSLPYTRLEVECVQNIVPVDSLINTPEAHGISVDEVLTHVADSHILHIACHGTQDQSNPLNSGFELMDGRLTLDQLMHVRIPNAKLAYLSACESAGMDEGRPDEGLNLAGAMIFAGFKSVIATMWAMDDVDGPFMAEHIYTRIFREGKLDMHMVPYAVDDAVQELRNLGVPASRWATYVHFGI